jgi:hypothetical protein
MGDEVEMVVREFLGRNQGYSYVNQAVFFKCYRQIWQFLDNSVLYPQLMSYKLVENVKDIKKLTSRNHLPHERRLSLLEFAGRAGEFGYMLLFMCIEQTSEETQGHADAARILQEMGMCMYIG